MDQVNTVTLTRRLIVGAPPHLLPPGKEDTKTFDMTNPMAGILMAAWLMGAVLWSFKAEKRQ